MSLAVPFLRNSRMLHSIVHKHKHWRQSGQLYCAFCVSSHSSSEKSDPSKIEVEKMGASSSSSTVNPLVNNAFYAKYAEKIQAKQKSSPEEFKAQIKSLEEERKRKKEEERKLLEEERKKAEEKALQPKRLDDILKMELIRDKTPEEIAEIWKEHFKDKDKIFAIMSKSEYEEIKKKSQQFSTFVYPVPRQQGYEFFISEFQGDAICFTSLVSFQAFKENAPPCLTITHFTELAEDKDIVLMVGEPDLKLLSVYESQLLALQVKLYYGINSGLKFNLVRQMNLSPDSFRYMDLIKEFENYKKDCRDARTGEY